MSLIPSLLEYSSLSLDQKIAILKDNGQTSLHLDFVCKYFAQDRVVLRSLSQETIFENLQHNFNDQRLYLSVHILANLQDTIEEVFDFWSVYNLNPKWTYDMFFPVQIFSTHPILRFSKEKNVLYGAWFDLDQWLDNEQFIISSLKVLNTTSCLLMTVKAGKSGQKLLPEVATKALEIVKKYPEIQFTLDGGWPLDIRHDLPNLRIVGYSSYWSQFRKKSTTTNQ